MNKSARILFLVAALASASLVSFLVYTKSSSTYAKIPPKNLQDTIEIAVAMKNLKRGEKIGDQDIQMVMFLKDTLPAGHFSDRTKLVGRIVVKPVLVTEPILSSSLAPADLTRGGIAAIISPQKRAMAVKVDDVVGVAGFLHPGHLVDVLVSVEKPGERSTPITKTVLENIPVLSIGTQAEESSERSPKKVTVVTLEVDLEEGEKLALAMNEGRIQLALRGYADTDQILTKGTNVASLLKSYASPSEQPVNISKPVPPPKPKPAKRGVVVEVMNGNQVKRFVMDTN